MLKNISWIKTKFINLFWPNKVSNNSYEVGQHAEILAKKYLKQNGFKIVAENYKTHVGEVDIIADKLSTLVCIEVKYRKDAEILPYVISEKQKYRVSRAFSQFIKYNKNYHNHYYRFDVIFIDAANRINHIENAWENK